MGGGLEREFGKVRIICKSFVSLTLIVNVIKASTLFLRRCIRVCLDSTQFHSFASDRLFTLPNGANFELEVLGLCKHVWRPM